MKIGNKSLRPAAVLIGRVPDKFWSLPEHRRSYFSCISNFHTPYSFRHGKHSYPLSFRTPHFFRDGKFSHPLFFFGKGNFHPPYNFPEYFHTPYNFLEYFHTPYFFTPLIFLWREKFSHPLWFFGKFSYPLNFLLKISHPLKNTPTGYPDLKMTRP